MRGWPHRLAAVALTLAAALSLAGCHSSARELSSSGPDFIPITRTVTVATASGTRTAIVHHPASVKDGAPLVVMLHGGFGSASQAEKSYSWDQEADQKGFVVVYPDGVNHAWNVGPDCCGTPNKQGVDDAAFLHALLGQVESSDHVDAHHVYAVGISNGAMMTYTWTCAYPQDLAGIGPVAGTLVADCPSPKPMTVIAIHGTADENVPIAGGVGPNGYTGVSYKSLAQTLAPFIAADGCPDTGATNGTPPVHITTSKCGHGTRIVTAVIDGAGHQWPGSVERSPAIDRALGLDKPDTHLNATDFLWHELHDGTDGGYGGGASV